MLNNKVKPLRKSIDRKIKPGGIKRGPLKLYSSSIWD